MIPIVNEKRRRVGLNLLQVVGDRRIWTGTITGRADQQRSSNAVGVVSSRVAMIPIKAILSGSWKAEREVPSRQNWILSHARYPIAIACPILNQAFVRNAFRGVTMPMNGIFHGKVVLDIDLDVVPFVDSD